MSSRAVSVVQNSKRQKRRGWGTPVAVWWILVVFLLFTVVFPLTKTFLSSFQTEDGAWTLANYARVLSDPSIRNSMWNSFRIVVPSTILATMLGVFLAWAVVRTNVPGKRLWKTLFAIPYFIPPFIGAVTWTFLLGPVGYFNKAMMTVFQLEEPFFNVYSVGGMIFVMTLYRFAVPFMVVTPTMQKVSASLEEAARISGASPWRTMRDITLPLLGPSIFGAMLLVFMFLLSDFGVSAVLGAPNRIWVMTTEIYRIINRPDMENNLQIASAYSMLLSILALIGLLLYNRIVGNDRFAVISGKSAAVEPTRLSRRGRWGLFAVLMAVFLTTTCSPIIAAFLTSITKVWGVPLSMANVTWANYRKLWTIRNIARAFRNSFVLATVAALVILFVTLIVSYVALRKNVRGARGVRAMRIMVTLPYSLPGTIIALSMILAFNQPLPAVGKLTKTFSILMIAYIARFLNLGYNNITGAISQIDPSLEEAARISGASQVQTFKDIVMPLLKNSLIASFFLVAAPALAEISLSSLLASTKNETIGTVVYAAQEEGKILRVAALAILLILVVVTINFIAQQIAGREERKHKKIRDRAAERLEEAA